MDFIVFISFLRSLIVLLRSSSSSLPCTYKRYYRCVEILERSLSLVTLQALYILIMVIVLVFSFDGNVGPSTQSFYVAT